MPERQTVKVTIHQQSVYGSIMDADKYQADTVKGLIEWLGEMLLQVPDEYRDHAKFEIESVGGYEGEHHSEVEIFYHRPETDEEMNNRVIRTNQRIDSDIARHERGLAEARARLRAVEP